VSLIFSPLVLYINALSIIYLGVVPFLSFLFGVLKPPALDDHVFLMALEIFTYYFIKNVCSHLACTSSFMSMISSFGLFRLS
jgi:hypothetical protein